MTREEAIRNINALNAVCASKEFYDEEFEKALQMAVKALEQEPILDKIRAEVMKLDDINPDYPMDRTIHISRNEVLRIIDKYKESIDVMGLTVAQGRQLLNWAKDLWVLLDQDDFNKIADVFKNAVDREEYYQEHGESEE